MEFEPFYHKYKTLISITISATTVVKAKNIALVTPSIIHKTEQVNIQSSELKLVNLSYLVGSVDRNNVSPELLFANILNTAAAELFMYTKHAVKHRKL